MATTAALDKERRRLTTRSKQSSGGPSVGRPSFLWSVPGFVFFALFAIVPLGVVIWLSFTSWQLLGSPHWVGTANWKSMFSDPVFIKSFRITLLLAGLGIVTQTPVAMLLGVWAAGYQRNRAILSAIYFIPLLMSAAAIAIVWSALLAPFSGLPEEFRSVFSSPIFNHGDLFSSGPAAIGVLTFVGMWQWTPFHTLIYQGGARNIPEVLYQAGAIDGCGRVRSFFHITLPQLRNTMITSMVLMLVGGLTTFDTILILTNGGPGTSTTATSFYMYETAFRSYDFGKASVIGVVLLVITAALSIGVVKLTGWDKMRSTQEGL
jgi:xylobiose transport system permease protein